MPIIKINEIEIYYEVHGQGMPLLMIEGFTCNRLMWKEYIEPLAEHYQLILFDNRGCGQTSSPVGPYSIQMLAEDTAALLQALHISHCYAIGHSMGGAILLQLCFSHPKLITKGLVANSFAKVPHKWKWNMQWMSKLLETGLEEKLVWEGIMPWLYSEEFMSDRQKVEQALIEGLNNPYPQPLIGYRGQAEALMTFDLCPYLKEIKTPLLIATGDEDLGFPLICAQELAENIPHAELYIFQGQGHMIVEERKDELLELIQNFFK